MVVVDVSVINSLICEYTDPMNIVYQSCFKLVVQTKRKARRSDERRTRWFDWQAE